MNRIKFACTALSVTALLLAGVLVMNLSSHSSVAQAAMTATKGDFSTLTTRTRAGAESLFVIDHQADMLVVYEVELRGRGGRMEPIVKENLARLFNFGSNPTASDAAGSGNTVRERTPR